MLRQTSVRGTSSATAKPAPDAPVVEKSEGFGIRSALGTIATTICIVMAVAVILGVVGSVLGFYRADTVLSGSMRPSYPEGSVVVATRSHPFGGDTSVTFMVEWP